MNYDTTDTTINNQCRIPTFCIFSSCFRLPSTLLRQRWWRRTGHMLPPGGQLAAGIVGQSGRGHWGPAHLYWGSKTTQTTAACGYRSHLKQEANILVPFIGWYNLYIIFAFRKQNNSLIDFLWYHCCCYYCYCFCHYYYTASHH